MPSYRTTIFGILAIILIAAGPILEHYHPLVGLNWTSTLTSIAVLVTGAGLVVAKDASVHSTVDQVKASTAVQHASGLESAANTNTSVPLAVPVNVVKETPPASPWK